MANPNKTIWNWKQRKLSCIAEEVFHTEDEAREYLKDKTGDRKVVRSFRVGRREDRLVKYVARVYVR